MTVLATDGSCAHRQNPVGTTDPVNLSHLSAPRQRDTGFAGAASRRKGSLIPMHLHCCPLGRCQPLADRPAASPPPQPERRPVRVSSGPAMKPVDTITSVPSVSTTPPPAPTSSTPAASSNPLPGARGYRVSLFGMSHPCHHKCQSAC